MHRHRLRDLHLRQTSPKRGGRPLSRPADFGSGRALVIPAAGAGSRLRSTLPKVLVPIAGRPMIDWLVSLYSPWVERFVIVASPKFRTAVSEHVARLGVPAAVLEQEAPTGMTRSIRGINPK